MRIGTDREDRETIQGSAPYAYERDKAAEPDRLSKDEQRELLDELMQLELSEAQARELLDILVWLMGFFVEHGFDGDICGQILGGLTGKHTVDSTSARIPFAAANGEARDKENAR